MKSILNWKKILAMLLSALLLFSCGAEKVAETEVLEEEVLIIPDNSLVEDEKQVGWMLLFDGISPDGWRGYNQTELPEGWIVEDGAIKSLGKGDEMSGDIVFGPVDFENFELVFEWKIEKGGNSGVFYHVVEDQKYAAPHFTGPEYQIIDQIGFPESIDSLYSLGGDYGMYPSNIKDVVRSAGDWNISRIVFTPQNVSYWLNGKKTLDFVPWSDDWNQRKSEGKWKDFPEYGKAKSGLIGLQDHGSLVWYKNIKIRNL